MAEYPDAWLRQGDVDADGVVNILDVMTIAKYLRKPRSDNPACDLDGDGWITRDDLERAARNFGLTYEAWLETFESKRQEGLLKIGAPLAAILGIFLGFAR